MGVAAIRREFKSYVPSEPAKVSDTIKVVAGVVAASGAVSAGIGTVIGIAAGLLAKHVKSEAERIYEAYQLTVKENYLLVNQIHILNEQQLRNRKALAEAEVKKVNAEMESLTDEGAKRVKARYILIIGSILQCINDNLNEQPLANVVANVSGQVAKLGIPPQIAKYWYLGLLPVVYVLLKKFKVF